MPTYEYECQQCNITFEKFQKINDPVLKKCPKCMGKVKRLISAGAGLIFKGSGFFITDYKKKSTVSESSAGKNSKKENTCPHNGNCNGCQAA